MTDVQPGIDLSALERPTPSQQLVRPRRRWRQLALPVLLVAGFVAILLWSLSDVLTARIEVTVLRPRKSDASAVSSGAIAFQAAGWVEPDPFPMHITPLTGGTVSEILVQESDEVKKGDPVARLVPDDADLELTAARAKRANTQAEVARAAIEFKAATQDFTEAITLTERVETTRAEFTGKQTEHEHQAQAAKLAEAEVRVATEEVAIQEHLREEGAAGPRQVELAVAKLDAARASLARARAAAAHAAAQVKVVAGQHKAALRHQRLRIDDRRRVDSAKEVLAAARAAQRAADAAVSLAELRKERTTVRSAWDGIVLERLTIPGSTVGGQGLAHTAICSLYDPKRLRIRIDVPLEDVGKATIGQKATIVAESRRGRAYSGEVSRIVQRADIQKVSLQVHVRVEDPDELLRPETLCHVRFEAKQQAAGQAVVTAVVLVPRRLIDRGSVWVLDADGAHARKRAVTTGANRGADVEVLSGINLSDKLIDNGRNELTDGARVRVREEN